MYQLVYEFGRALTGLILLCAGTWIWYVHSQTTRTKEKQK